MCRLKEFEKLYEYLGEQTCAADGMCQEKCPVKINTGDLIKHMRKEELEKNKTAGGMAMVCGKQHGTFVLEEGNTFSQVLQY